jgi:spermidine/putrescine transport system permease protein
VSTKKGAAVGKGLRARLAPYALIFPGGLWLLLFFVVPMATMLSLSLQQGDVVNGYQMTWHWETYSNAFKTYDEQIYRSLWYGLITTVAQIVLAFPIAYWIAMYGGRNKSTYLFLVLLPFFVSFVLRTFAWKFMLADDGFILGYLKDWHLMPADFHVLNTPFAVISGLTYNYLPFMVLPLYVALERIDPRLLEAARDLYANPFQVFRRVVFPLSLPGVFAGILMTFVPTSSDYVNSTVLGGTATTMIGNVIQRQYLTQQNYPTASALSFGLMAALLIGVFTYARILGTEDVLKAAAR